MSGAPPFLTRIPSRTVLLEPNSLIAAAASDHLKMAPQAGTAHALTSDGLTSRPRASERAAADALPDSVQGPIQPALRGRAGFAPFHTCEGRP